ncbi:hypothetical protein JHK87_055297 [Glycine soja]|nr:hypothetical protein JHK87_055297 [Glycine soja]
MAQLSEPFLRLVIINVNLGRDIIKPILEIAHRGHVNLTVLSTSGTVTKVTLHNSLHGDVALTLHGPFTLLSLNNSYLFNNHYNLNYRVTLPLPLSFRINLSNSRGQVTSVIVGDNVKITLSTFRNPEIYKYILEGNKGNNDDKKNYYNNLVDSNGGSNQLGFNMVSCGVCGC